MTALVVAIPVAKAGQVLMEPLAQSLTLFADFSVAPSFQTRPSLESLVWAAAARLPVRTGHQAREVPAEFMPTFMRGAKM